MSMEAANATRPEAAIVTGPDAWTDAQLLDEIRRASVDIHRTRDELDAAVDRRNDLFREGRRRQPPILQRVLAEAAGVSDVAVVLAVRGK